MNNLRRIVENTLVPHTAFNEGMGRLQQCYDSAEGSTEPICLAILGNARTGKSRMLEEFFVKYAQRRTPEGLVTPIARVKTPSKPTVKALAELMLRAMGDPKFDKGTENGRTLRLRTLMQNSSCVMVMIDEFQHFYDKASDKIMYHVADWLKILVDDARVALVVAGLPSCRAVISQNEQLAGRFLSPIIMPRFDWTTTEHREEFVAILGAFQATIGALFDMPALDSPEMMFRCYCATGGLMGYLTKFLRQAVWDAIDDNRKIITLENLATAHVKAVWNQAAVSDVPAPFHRAFKSMPTADLLEKVRLIGAPVPPPPRESRRRAGPLLSDVFTAEREGVFS